MLANACSSNIPALRASTITSSSLSGTSFILCAQPSDSPSPAAPRASGSASASSSAARYAVPDTTCSAGQRHSLPDATRSATPPTAARYGSRICRSRSRLNARATACSRASAGRPWPNLTNAARLLLPSSHLRHKLAGSRLTVNTFTINTCKSV